MPKPSILDRLLLTQMVEMIMLFFINFWLWDAYQINFLIIIKSKFKIEKIKLFYHYDYAHYHKCLFSYFIFSFFSSFNLPYSFLFIQVLYWSYTFIGHIYICCQSIVYTIYKKKKKNSLYNLIMNEYSLFRCCPNDLFKYH